MSQLIGLHAVGIWRLHAVSKFETLNPKTLWGSAPVRCGSFLLGRGLDFSDGCEGSRSGSTASWTNTVIIQWGLLFHSAGTVVLCSCYILLYSQHHWHIGQPQCGYQYRYQRLVRGAATNICPKLLLRVAHPEFMRIQEGVWSCLPPAKLLDDHHNDPWTDLQPELIAAFKLAPVCQDDQVHDSRTLRFLVTLWHPQYDV